GRDHARSTRHLGAAAGPWTRRPFRDGPPKAQAEARPAARRSLLRGHPREARGVARCLHPGQRPQGGTRPPDRPRHRDRHAAAPHPRTPPPPPGGGHTVSPRPPPAPPPGGSRPPPPRPPPPPAAVGETSPTGSPLPPPR